jgi:hypothetical protein
MTALVGCGGNVVVDGDAASSSSSSSSSGMGGSTGTTPQLTTSTTTTTGGGSCTRPSGDCMSDADCDGGRCEELTPGGYKICVKRPPEATSCPMPMLDQCCTSEDCEGGGKCYSTKNIPACAGGPAMPDINVCVNPDCSNDARCAGGPFPQICAPAGAFGNPVKACFQAFCKTDADCTAKPCGACVTVNTPCCDLPAGLACVYPGDCRKDSDCSPNHCQIQMGEGTTACTMPGVIICPT